MSLGLEFFQKISHATPEAQARILYSNPWRRDHFISSAVCQYRGPDYSYREAHSEGKEFISEKEGPSAGLVWSKISDLGSLPQEWDSLRSWGYVFWDQKRLENWKLLEWDLAHWPRM
jgi:hypothetical protein